MILDIIVLVIWILPVITGFHRGVLNMLIRMFGWIAALVAGFLLAEPVGRLLAGTFVGESVSQALSDRIAAPVNSVDPAAAGLPQIISEGLTEAAEGAAGVLVELLTTMVLTVIGFLLVVFLTRFLLRILVRPASRRKNAGVLNKVNRLLGLAAGALEGLILVLLFMALLVPAAGVADSAISRQLESSLLAGALYDNNFLLIFMESAFS